MTEPLQTAPQPPDDGPAAERSSLGGPVAWPVRRAWWSVQEKVLWRSSDSLRSAGSSVRWPFEKVAWSLRRRLAWPVADRYAERGRAGRTGIAAAVLIAAGTAAFAGLQAGTPQDRTLSGGSPQLAAAVASPPSRTPPTAVPVVPVPVQPASEAPVLQGATPTFEPEQEDQGQDSGAEDAPTSTPSPAAVPDADAATDDETSPPPEDTVEPLRVARRFAKAFVLYEVGEKIADARAVFRETAAPELARALADRPPRQPADVEVPKAKVLNLVPGPLRHKQLPVSVSLLRLGSTSELRLDLELDEDGTWLVGDVRG